MGNPIDGFPIFIFLTLHFFVFQTFLCIFEHMEKTFAELKAGDTIYESRFDGIREFRVYQTREFPLLSNMRLHEFDCIDKDYGHHFLYIANRFLHCNCHQCFFTELTPECIFRAKANSFCGSNFDLRRILRLHLHPININIIKN